MRKHCKRYKKQKAPRTPVRLNVTTKDKGYHDIYLCLSSSSIKCNRPLQKRSNRKGFEKQNLVNKSVRIPESRKTVRRIVIHSQGWKDKHVEQTSTTDRDKARRHPFKQSRQAHYATSRVTHAPRLLTLS